MRSVTIVLGTVGLAFFAAPAGAFPVTWEFAGEITHIIDEDNILGGDVGVGTPFSGSFTFESTTPDSDPGEPRRGLYSDAITVVSGQVGGFPFLGPVGVRNSIRVENDFGSSTLDVYAAKADVAFLDLTMDFSLLFIDGSGTVFSSDLLSVTPPYLNSFDTARFGIFDLSETIPLSVDGAITSLVPEPATLLLLAPGSVILFRRRLFVRYGNA